MANRTRSLLVKVLLPMGLLGAISVALVWRYMSKHPPPDLKSALIQVLGIDANAQGSLFFVNLPPSPCRAPGSFFVNQALCLGSGDLNNPKLQRGPLFQVTGTFSANAEAEAGSSFGVMSDVIRGYGSGTMDVTVTDAQQLLLDETAIKDLAKHSDEVASAEDKGTDPLVVTTAFSGILKFTLRRNRTSSSSWAAAKRAAENAKARPGSLAGATLSFQGTADSGDAIVFSTTTPVIFAFNASTVSFLNGHLAPGDKASITVRLAPASRVAAAPSTRFHADSKAPWALMTITSGFFRHWRSNDQEWIGESANLFEETLAPFGPAWVERIRSTEKTPLTNELLLAKAKEVGTRAKAAGQHLVLYYAGHTVTTETGDIRLMLSEAKKRTSKPPRPPPPTAKEVGGKAADLFTLASGLQQELEQSEPGYLRLADLYGALKETGADFTIIIDGCFESQQAKSAEELLGFHVRRVPVNGFPAVDLASYPGDSLSTEESLSGLADVLEHYEDGYPYLHRSHAVILATKPGTFAEAVHDPRDVWRPLVAPFARRLFLYQSKSWFDEEPLSLYSLLANSVDSKSGTGEIEALGSITWSDLTGLEAWASEVKMQAYPK